LNFGVSHGIGGKMPPHQDAKMASVRLFAVDFTDRFEVRCLATLMVVSAQSTKSIRCAYCGETFELLLEPGAQEFVTDCEVCCRPLRVTVTDDPDDEPSVEPA
jgi:hypothetical protein